jgi:hypothetical protein
MRRVLPISATILATGFLALLSASACGPSNTPAGDDGTGGNTTGGVSGAAGAALGGTPTGGSGGASGGTGATAGSAAGGAAGTGTGGTLGGVSGGGGAGGDAVGGAAGASGGTAGASGGTSGDGGTGVGGAGAGGGPNNALFSDGFEGTSLDTAKWTPRLNGQGMLTIDTSRKHSGNSSLRVQCNNAYSTLIAKEGAPIFPAPNNTYFGRVWFYVPAPLPTDHVIWLESGVVANDQHEVRIGMHLGYGQINLWQNGEVDIREPTAPMRPDAWICLEFRMGPDVLEIWMDGARVDGLSTTNWVAANQANGNQTPRSNWSPMHAAFRLGWELNGNTREIWYDDVALGHARIGCN